jgi:hypothetical protein
LADYGAAGLALTVLLFKRHVLNPSRSCSPVPKPSVDRSDSRIKQKLDHPSNQPYGVNLGICILIDTATQTG